MLEAKKADGGVFPAWINPHMGSRIGQSDLLAGNLPWCQPCSWGSRVRVQIYLGVMQVLLPGTLIFTLPVALRTGFPSEPGNTALGWLVEVQA